MILKIQRHLYDGWLLIDGVASLSTSRMLFTEESFNAGMGGPVGISYDALQEAATSRPSGDFPYDVCEIDPQMARICCRGLEEKEYTPASKLVHEHHGWVIEVNLRGRDKPLRILTNKSVFVLNDQGDTVEKFKGTNITAKVRFSGDGWNEKQAEQDAEIPGVGDVQEKRGKRKRG